MDVPEIDVEQLEPLIAEGVKVVDVREPHEWAQGYIDGVALISMSDVPEHIDELPEDAPVYIICARGNRSRRVTEYLMQQGLDAYNVAGGMMAWIDAGKPTRQDPPAG